MHHLGDPDPKLGEPFQIRWGVWNPGWAPTGEYQSWLRVEREELPRGVVVFSRVFNAPSLDVEEIQEWNWPVTVEHPGEYCAYLELDIGNEVDELSELNNTSFSCIRIPSPPDWPSFFWSLAD